MRPVCPLVVPHVEEHPVLGLVQLPGGGPRLVHHPATLHTTSHNRDHRQALLFPKEANIYDHCQHF